MKKNIKNALIITLVITLVWSITNIVFAYTQHKLPFSKTDPNVMDAIIYDGIGFSYRHSAVIGPDSGSPISNMPDVEMTELLTMIGITFAVSLGIVIVIDKVKNKNTK